MSTLQMKIGAGSVGCENYRDVYHFSAIYTWSTVEPLALSTALLSISYLIVIVSGRFFSLPGLHRKLCFLAELSKCPVKPLVTTFLLQEVSPSPSQMTREGKETFTMLWEIPSLEKRSKWIVIRNHSARSLAHEGPWYTGPDGSVMGTTLHHWEPSKPGSSTAL